MPYHKERLHAANALDFDDLLLRTLQLFLEHPPVLENYRQRFRYVHVDEYQDTNLAQYALIKLLTKEQPESLRRGRRRPEHLRLARARISAIFWSLRRTSPTRR